MSAFQNILCVVSGFVLVVASFAMGLNDEPFFAALFLIGGGALVTVFGSRLLDGGRK